MILTPQQINARAGRGLERFGSIRSIDEDARTVELSFSSEAVVQRWFGDEVLEHSPDAMRLDRLQKGAAVLINHDWDDQVGVVESVTIGADKRGRAVVRFGRSARANEIWQDVIDGIRKHVSVGYSVLKIEVEKRKGQPDLVRVTEWEPFEISLVTVPADPSVGVGRAQSTNEGNTMPEDNDLDERIRSLLDLGRAYGADDLAAIAIREGATVEDLRARILKRMNDRGGAGAPLAAFDDGYLGMNDREMERFSIVRLATYLAMPSPETAAAAGLELEASRAFARSIGREPQGAFLPPDILGRRDFMNTGTPSQGGNIVATNLMAGNFIDELRAQLAVLQGGATMIAGLVGNVAMPKQLAGGSHQWLPEGGNVINSKLTLGVVSMSPKTVASSIPMTRRLLLQSTPDIESLVRRDLVARIALAIDAAALNGDDSPHAPTGLRELLVATALDWESGAPSFKEIVDLETRVNTANASGPALGYIYNSGVSGHLKTLPLQTGAPVFVEQGDQVNGYRRVRSNQALAKDVFFGNWADMLIGMWSGLDLRVDPFTLAASDGLVLRAFQDVDVAVRHVESFSLGRVAPVTEPE